jgi:hypothetical protein
MANECKEYLIRTATGSTRVKTCINPDNPGTAPTIVDKNNNLLFTWSTTNNKFEPQTGVNNNLPPGSGFGQDETYQSLLTQNQEVFTSKTTEIINSLPTDKKDLFASSNTFTPYNRFLDQQQAAAAARPLDSGGDGDDETPTDIRSVSSPEPINYAKSGAEEKRFGPLIYPEKNTENGQDYIKFEVFEYISQKLSDNNLLFEQRSSYTNPIGTIVLPIQPTISDTNTVTWNDSRMGILEMMGANISLGAMNSTGTDYMTTMANKFGETIKGVNGEAVSPAVVTAVQNYIAKMAVSSNTNLLSRTAGAITNPNLNLLFESPDLRNFTFNFKLTPRTEKEGTIVRRIIRKFKEHMAAQKSVGNLFLETPDVFNIKYIRGADKSTNYNTSTHKSLNLFKTCALRNFSVNYTPAGTYMTYNDPAGTMSSYDLTMSFTELEPVYWNDYNDKQNPIADDQIGY